MTTSSIWIKLIQPKESPWTRVSLNGVEYVDDLKKTIKKEKPVDLKDYDADNLIIKAKKTSESDDQAVKLENPEEPIGVVQQRFGHDFRVFVSVPAGVYSLRFWRIH